jgi:hypothetical protein
MLEEIPKGLYCYKFRERREGEPELNEKGFPILYTNNCPHYTEESFGGVNMPWCSFLEAGGWDNREYSEAELKAIGGAFGSQREQEETLRLFLLWDGCKECGENLEDE